MFSPKNVVPGSYRHVLRIALPMVLGNAAFTIMQFTDRMLLARHSSEAIEAALPSGVLTFTLVGFFAAVAGYSGTFVSQYHGAGDREGCARACVSGIIISLVCIPAFLLLIPAADWITRISGHRESLQALEHQYAFWMILAGCPTALHWTFGGYLSGRNRVVAGTVVSILSCAVNIVLDYILIFGKCGFPCMGLEGAAIATFVSQIVGLFFVAVPILTDPDSRNLPWLSYFRKPDWSLVRRVIRFGTPSGVQLFFDAGAFSLYIMLTGTLDELSLATSNIAFSINHLAISPLIGLGGAAAVLVGQFQGARDSANAMKAGDRCMHLGWCYMAAMAVLFVALPETLLSLFKSPDAPYTVAEMVSLGRRLLVLLAMWGMFDAMNAVYFGCLKGAGDTRFILLFITIMNWAFWIPVEYLVLRVFKWGLLPSWYVQVVFIILIAAGVYLRWKRGPWSRIDLLGRTAKQTDAGLVQ